jgi:hypothetical protein
VPTAARRFGERGVDTRELEPGRGVCAHSGDFGTLIDDDLFDREQAGER